MTMTTADRSRCSVQVLTAISCSRLIVPAAAAAGGGGDQTSGGPASRSFAEHRTINRTAAPDGFSPLLWDRAIVLRSRRGEAMEMEWGKGS